MISRYENQGTHWIDIEQPSPGEIRTIAREFSIGPRIEAELAAPTPYPLVAGDEEHVLLVLHFPGIPGEHGAAKRQEIDFVIGKNFILTIRYEVVAPLHRLKKILETNDLVGEGVHLSTDVLLEILFAHLFESIRDHVNHIAGRLTRVERDVFDGLERDVVERLSHVSREFLHLEATVASHEEPLTRFLHTLERRRFFGPSFVERSARIRGENSQLMRLISTHRSLASELRESNDALISTKQNEAIRTLAAITVLIMPAELIIFIFDMGVPGAPLAEHPNAFWVILGIMAVVVATLYIIFARKRWF